MLIIKGIVFELTDDLADSPAKMTYFKQIVQKIFEMPKHVLVVKAAIFLFIDSASAFAYTQLQDLFP